MVCIMSGLMGAVSEYFEIINILDISKYSEIYWLLFLIVSLFLRFDIKWYASCLVQVMILMVPLIT